MITRGQIKFEIWEKLNKSAQTKGFYTDSKVNLAIQESIDYVASMMFLHDEGWLHKIDYLDTQSNQLAIPIPQHIAMIAELRYLVGNVYLPLMYDQDYGNAQWSGASGATQFPSRYRIVDNQIYFNPALGVGGSKFLQVEYMAYPKRLQQDSDFLESQFDRSMYYYIIYRSCSILASNIAQFAKPWKEEEAQWYNNMASIITTRNQQSTPIKDFEGF